VSDEDLDRLVRESRPHTDADDGWTSTPAGEHALIGIRARLERGRRVAGPLVRRPRLVGLGVGLAAATAAAVAVGLASGPAADDAPHLGYLPGPGGQRGPVPAHTALVAYTNCDSMLTGLRSHAAHHVGAFGLQGYLRIYAQSLDGLPVLGPVELGGAKALQSAPAHSTTNTQELGVGEPDIVATDGRRIVSVSGGVLRVVDAATHEITGRLDLRVYAGAQNAQLLMSGDRVLVILDNYAPYFYGGLVGRYPYPGPVTGAQGTTIALVDVGQPSPSIIGTLHTDGRYVQARMVGDTVRMAVQTTPLLTLPTIRGRLSAKQRTARNRAAVERAPLAAWLPSYQVDTAGRSTSNTVPCTSVSHPAHYTGTSMLTVYTVALTGDLADPEPISLAASGSAVYASTSSLYIADERNTAHQGVLTQLDRFDIAGAGKPVYLGSNTIPGTLLDSYSMSEYEGTLRVVTTTAHWPKQADTAVTVLDANTLAMRGRVGGLASGEQVHAVRFLGPLAYVVTFRSVDPMFVVDLRDPAHPTVAGELTMSGYSDYLHPIDDGRLLGVGEDVTQAGRVNGLQVSLFDVTSPAHPRRLATLVRQHSPSETPIDPHAFLYWAPDHLAVVPIDSWYYRQSGAALVVRVAGAQLRDLGTIRNPGGSNLDNGPGIERTLVIGDDLWTMSASGLQASGLHSLAREAWVPFR
jgi:Beta propeller domain